MDAGTTHAETEEQSLQIEKEFQSIIPPLSDEEAEGLEASIVREGCREKILVWGNIIVDGHHRFAICEANGIPYETRGMEFEDRTAVKIWIIQNQFSRRNLTPMVRAELALRLKPLLADDARIRQLAGGGVGQNSAPGQSGKTREKLAKTAGLSKDSIAKTEKITRHAAAPIMEMARHDEVSLDAAALVAELPKTEQRKIAKEGPAAVKKKAKELRQEKPKGRFDHLPEEIRPVFEEADVFDEMLNHLTQITKLFNQASGGNIEKDGGKPMLCGIGLAKEYQGGMALIRNLRHFISSHQPAGFCVYCRGKDPARKKCKPCLGGGWSNAHQWSSASKNQKENPSWNK